MAKKKQIPITCTGSKTVPLDELQNFQGNLKTLEKPQLDKLKRSIVKYGFSFPVFVWGTQILDGHQRLFATKELVKDGYMVADIPVVEIEAADKKEAGEKLLALNSSYAKITGEGLYEFLHDMDIDIGALADDLELPDIDMDKFLTGWVGGQEPNFEPGTEDDQGKLDELSPKLVECPHCQTVFDSRGNEQS